MKQFDDNLRKRFKDKNSLEGINSDALWNNIANKLPEIDNKPKKRYGLYFLSSLLLITVLSITGYLTVSNNVKHKVTNITKSTDPIKSLNSEQLIEVLDKNEQTNIIVNNAQKEEASINEPALESNKLASGSPNSIKQRVNNIEIKSNIKRETQIAVTPSLPHHTSAGNNTALALNIPKARASNGTDVSTEPSVNLDRINSPIIAFKNNNNSQRKQLSTSTALPTITGTIYSNTNTGSLFNKENIPNTSKIANQPNLVQPLSPFGGLKINNSNTTLSNVTIEKQPHISCSSIPHNSNNSNATADKRTALIKDIAVPSHKKGDFSVLVATGVNVSINRYSSLQSSESDIANLLNQVYDIQLGSENILQVAYTFKNGFFISSSFGFSAVNAQLNRVLKYDTLVSYSSTSYLVDATATRTVRHRNHHHFLHIPLGGGYQYAIKNWVIEIELGTALNITTHQSGKRLYPNRSTIVAYNNEEVAVHKTLSYSVYMRPSISHQLNKAFALQLSTLFRQQFNPKFTLEGQEIRHRTFHIAPQFGVRYYW